MAKVGTKILGGALVTLVLSGCQLDKSSNPLSPAVAGPIEGVVISTPALLEPGQDWELRSRDQPVKLLFQNSASNGVRPLKHSIDIASDSAFNNIVFARTGVEPNASGVTQLQLPDKLAAGTYWWRTRADDGANMGPYSNVKSFVVFAEVILAPPTPSAPANGSTIGDLTPLFKIKGGDRSGVTADLEYTIQVSNNSSFTSIAATFVETESWPNTTIERNYSLLYGRTYYWRIRARHTGDSEMSNWSSTLNFRTPAEPVAAPPPPSQPGGGSAPDPNPGPSNPSSCSSSQGSDIAGCIESRYPQYLAAGVSLSRRMSNMEFLRNKMIEHGRCKGLDLGLNLKRGGPTISTDFIVWRRQGKPDMGVDVGSAYDDTGRRLRLSWHTYDPPDYGYPYYKAYGSASCS